MHSPPFSAIVTAARALAVLLLLAGCAARAVPRDELVPARAVRGDSAQTALLSPDERLATQRVVVRDFFRPTGGQARWIDPRPLPARRDSQAEADARPDDDWAEHLAAATDIPRVCPLLGENDAGENAPCRGRPGGVLRISAPYALAGGDTVVVYARYAPVRAEEDPSAAAERRGDELEFQLVRRRGGWHIARHRTVQAP
jgi:hypothetical protein